MSSLPPPLTPSNADLRDMPYMPLEITRLFGSEFHARVNDTEWRAGVTLWLKAFHQVPAGSLPNDDVVLARLAEYGRNVEAWQTVRAAALKGWILGDDGRLWHPVVAEKALEAWIGKLAQRKMSSAGNAARWGSKDDQAASLQADLNTAVEMLARLNPHSRALHGKFSRRSHKDPEGIPTGLPTGVPQGSQDKLREDKGNEDNPNQGKILQHVGDGAGNGAERGSLPGHSSSKAYAFEKGIIRLTASELNELVEANPSIAATIKSYLISAGGFAERQWGAAWKDALANWLRKKNQERELELMRARVEAEERGRASLKPRRSLV